MINKFEKKFKKNIILKKKFKKNFKNLKKNLKNLYIQYIIYINMSNDITTIASMEINKEYMLYLHRELWLLRDLLEKHKIVYEEKW